MKTILDDIKKASFKPIYLIYGEEGKLREDATKKLADAILSDDGVADSFGEDLDVGELINSANTLSFFGGLRLVKVKDSGVFSSAADDGLLEYFKAPNPSTVVIFNEKKVDKRNKLYKAISKTGYALECKKAKPKDVRDFVIRTSKANSKRFEKNALDLFTSNLDADLSMADNELEKLMTFTLGKEAIAPEDVDNIVTKKLDNRIFDLVDAVCQKRTAIALDIFSNMILLKESPVMILISLARQFRMILQYKFLSMHMGHQDIVKRLGAHPYAVSKVAACSKSFSSKALMEALTDCRDLMKSAFSGNIELERGIEILILKYTA